MADKPSIIGGVSPIEAPRVEKPIGKVERPEGAIPSVRVEKEARPVERAPVQKPAHPSPTPALQQKKRIMKSEERKEIEEILAEDLEEVYVSLPASARAKFRVEGEKAAGKIEILLKHTKLAIMEVIKVIREWLLVLPGVNRFFVEQEAKIKADKLIHLHKKEGE